MELGKVRHLNTKHFSQAIEDHQIVKYHFPKALDNNFKNCADNLETEADCRKCMEENSGTYARMKPWKIGKTASGLRKTHKMTPQQEQAQFRDQ